LEIGVHFMESARIERIRQGERNYHEACYEEYKLFEPGSWLYGR
jgi:hypothetical protein